MGLIRKVKYRLLASFILAVLDYGTWINVAARQEVLSPGSERMAYSLQGALVLVLVINLIAITQIWKEEWLTPLLRIRQGMGRLRWVLILLSGSLPVWFYYFSQLSVNFRSFFIRLVINLFFLGVMAWLAAGEEKAPFNWNGLLMSTILYGTFFTAGSVFREVSSFPFGLYWSEGNRFYDYSILFGRSRYLYDPDLPLAAYIDPARQSLWGSIFIFPQVSIWAMRFWNGIVFSLPYILLGWVILKKGEERGRIWVLFGLWAFLFLNQGPIYTPLILSAILVVLTRRMPLKAGFAVMLAAGLYARLGRMTWMFAPAMLAAYIAILETGATTIMGEENISPPVFGKISLKQFFAGQGKWTWNEGWQRAIVLASAGLIGGYFLPLLVPQIRSIIPGGGGGLSVQGISQTVGRQPLLWDRLLPNSTYPPGILLGLLTASAPLVLLLVVWIWRRQWDLNGWQKLVLAAVNLAFLGVGILVSVKIGGGSNLHNLDMFFLAMLFAAALAWEAGAHRWVTSGQQKWWERALLLAVVVIPSWPGVMHATAHAYPPQSRISEVATDIQQAAEKAFNEGEVLFMDQRQLLTFGTIKGVPLVPEYEKKLLMDEAMADNGEYFEPFIKDLASHRFSLIISEPLLTNFQYNKSSFSEENNAWVRWVSVPVLCYYKPVMTYYDMGVQLLVPKERSAPKFWLSCP